jgi:5-methyltetrahydropteroyltriglutamate--homocysteine methyltransferase
MTAKYRAEQVGSLLRPPELLEARARNVEGKLSQNELRATEDRVILQALEKQRQIGIDVFTDGEMRRASWLHDMAVSVDGFVPHQIMLDWKGPGGAVEASHALAAGAKLRKVRQMTAHETPFLKKNASGPFKITLPAPSNFMLASYQRGITDRFYATQEDLLADLVDIIRDENQWLVSQDVTYIQLDAPFYSHYLDPEKRKKMRDPDAEFDKAVQGDNATLKGLPRERLTIAFHICRGNNRSRWYTEGGYDAIAEKLFSKLDADTFLLEYDSERSGGFEPLRLLPRGKTVVLGLITTKEPALESQDQLLRKIDQAARYVPLEDLAISTQCGFASVAAGNLLTVDEQWRKLELVVNTARKVWGSEVPRITTGQTR